MQVTRARFGEHVSLDPLKDGGMAIWHLRDRVRIDDPTRTVDWDDTLHDPPAMDRTPFERADFGGCDRLQWPRGACAMQGDASLATWSQRFAMWSEDVVLAVVDATRSDVLRLALPHDLFGSRDIVRINGGAAWFQGRERVGWIALADVEALFATPPGALELRVRELYPRRRAGGNLTVVIDTVDSTEARAHALDEQLAVTFPAVPGIFPGMRVDLHDELVRGVYREITLPGLARQPLYKEPVPTETIARSEVTLAPAVDPAGELVRPAATVREGDLDQLFAQLADAPDDAATRLVIVDVLEDAGEPYAAQLARLLAGDDDATLRRDALGTLASYLDDVEYRDHLPWAAALASTAPLDDAIGDIVAADRRLGFFHTLRLGGGNYRVYCKLLASPRAVGLRHVDVPRAQILAALIAGGRRDVRRLSNVKFATREVIDALADSTFDRVVEIETETAAGVAARLLDFVVRDETRFFARAPRHLVLAERAGHDAELVAPVLAAWPRLPLAHLTVAGVTLARDGTASAVPGASPAVRALVATHFRFA